MQDYISIGATPCDEPCAQVGQPGYRKRALAECLRFTQLLRQKFGPEPRGAWLTPKWFPHDFGEYVEVVCYFTTEIEASVEYALRCEAEMPATWGEETAEQTVKACPQCGHALKVLLFLGITPDGYGCETCQLYLSEDLQPLAHIIA
jgi:DNA-directed RNA polymerase subunit RPC12/RpoP